MLFNNYKPIVNQLLDDEVELIEGLSDIFDLELAILEYQTLNRVDLINRSAYFGKIDGKETTHVQACNLQKPELVHQKSSFRTKVFFLDGKYSTGYATHSLFPYKGKFHPQFLRGLLNILGVKQGQIVLDPMAGSSTLAVEANLIGVDAISLDISPFCQLMGRVKTFALDLDYKKLENFDLNRGDIFHKLHEHKFTFNPVKGFTSESNRYLEIFLLAYLDAMGFSNRSSKSIDSLFPRVIERYILTIKYFQEAREKLGLRIGKSDILLGSALLMPIETDAVDVIITSPPYSFAINYLENDKPQLNYLGVDTISLKNDMIGLQGKGLEEKISLYFNDMKQVFRETIRVSKTNSPIVIVVGNNTIQTKGILLDEKLVEIGVNEGLRHDYTLKKPIRGLQNSMKEESVLFFTNRK